MVTDIPVEGQPSHELELALSSPVASFFRVSGTIGCIAVSGIAPLAASRVGLQQTKSRVSLGAQLWMQLDRVDELQHASALRFDTVSSRAMQIWSQAPLAVSDATCEREQTPGLVATEFISWW